MRVGSVQVQLLAKNVLAGNGNFWTFFVDIHHRFGPLVRLFGAQLLAKNVLAGNVDF